MLEDSNSPIFELVTPVDERLTTNPADILDNKSIDSQSKASHALLRHSAESIAQQLHAKCQKGLSTQQTQYSVTYEVSESLCAYSVILDINALSDAFHRLAKELTLVCRSNTLFLAHSLVDNGSPLIVYKIASHTMSSAMSPMTDIAGDHPVSFVSPLEKPVVSCDGLSMSEYFCHRVAHQIDGKFCCIKLPNNGAIYTIAIPAINNRLINRDE